MMLSQLTRPSAAKLEKEIGDLKREIAAIETEHNQAEGSAVESSTDENAYRQADAACVKLQARIAERRKKLNRLMAAHDKAVMWRGHGMTRGAPPFHWTPLAVPILTRVGRNTFRRGTTRSTSTASS